MSFELADSEPIPAEERVSTDRPDYTTEQSTINVDLDVQAARVVGVVFANSTDTITSSGFEGSWTKTGEFLFVRGAVKTDVAGIIYIDQSYDGEGDGDVISSQDYAGDATNGGFVSDIALPYARIRFVPTTSGTSTFTVWARFSMGG